MDFLLVFETNFMLGERAIDERCRALIHQTSCKGNAESTYWLGVNALVLEPVPHSLAGWCWHSDDRSPSRLQKQRIPSASPNSKSYIALAPTK